MRASSPATREGGYHRREATHRAGFARHLVLPAVAGVSRLHGGYVPRRRWKSVRTA
ncbi:hypothetical protein ACU4GD_14640 [Cupriavidus basilensis]